MKNKGICHSFIVWVLHAITASAMGGPFRPGWPPLPSYAAFTRAQLERIPEADISATQARMFRTAHKMGRLLRFALFIRSEKQAQKTVFWLYRQIGIELDGTCPGTVIVRRCYFSEYYTPEMCRIMSSMDRGIFAGLFGGGELTFTDRITEGCSCCHAVFARKEKEV